ncbi:hypothetical protein EBY67_01500 [bacterium]|nr:hypothetical protein [bacterium]
MYMKCFCLSLGALCLSGIWASAAPSMESTTQPFDFDTYRRNPIDARRSSSADSRGNRNLQTRLISGETTRPNDISQQAADLFPPIATIPLRRDPEPLPTPNELTDQITVAKTGETTKGQKDLLARGKIAKELNLSAMSESDYEIYVSQRRAKEEEPLAPQNNLLNPMPTVTNLKTGGPAHAYSVSQAGIGSRTKPGSNQNPFEDVLKVFRLDQPITHGTDALPSGNKKVATATAPAPSATPDSEKPSPSGGTYGN